MQRQHRQPQSCPSRCGAIVSAPRQVSGQTIVLNGQPYTVVGVAAAGFSGMQVGRRAAFWVPLSHSSLLLGEDFLGRPGTSWLTLVGRLRVGATAEPARQELDAILRRVRESSGRPVEPVVLRPGARGDSMLSEQLASPMMLLLAAGALVLLVACLNVANLQLVRTEARRRELAVRSALGARRAQLVRLVLIDGSLMAVAGGAAGVWIAVLFKDQAASLIALYGQPVALSIPLDGRILVAAFAPVARGRAHHRPVVDVADSSATGRWSSRRTGRSRAAAARRSARWSSCRSRSRWPC